jgi:hypothetical protein
MITGVLLLILLIVLIFMAIRDGKPFFGDPLKAASLLIVLVVVLATWLPMARGIPR